MNRKMTIDLPSFVAGCLTASVIAIVLEMPFREYAGMIPHPGTLAVVSLAVAIVFAAVGLVARTIVAERRNRVVPLVAAGSATRRKIEKHRREPLGQWLKAHHIDPASVMTKNDVDEAERRLAAEFEAQVERGDPKLADQISALLLFDPDKMRAMKIMEKVAESAWRDIAADRKVDLSPVMTECDIPERSYDRVAIEIRKKHAHPVTRMVAAASRTDVRLVPSEFLWLRDADTDLWFALNNCGRSTFAIEGIGPLAHYHREKKTGQPIDEPDMKDVAGAVLSQMIANNVLAAGGA